MCHPAAIGLGVGALSAYSTQKAQVAQHEAAVGAYNANIDASTQAKVEADRQINLNQAQAEEKAALEKIANNLQTRRLSAKTSVAQGETGAIQNNNAIMQDMMRQGLVANNMISSNMQREGMQRHEGRVQQQSNYQSRINSVARPDWDSSGALMNSLLAGASTGLQAGMGAAMMGIGSAAAAGTPAAFAGTNGMQSAVANPITGAVPQMSLAPTNSFFIN